MNGEIFIGEKKYISASRAAKLTGYAMDYIGQLARSNKVDSKMIGRSWYVVEESLLGYKREVLDVAFSGKNAKKNRSLTKKKKHFRRSDISTPKILSDSTALIAWVAPESLTAPLPLPDEAPLRSEAPSLPAPVFLQAPSLRFVTAAELDAIKADSVLAEETAFKPFKAFEAGEAAALPAELSEVADGQEAPLEEISAAPMFAFSETAGEEDLEDVVLIKDFPKKEAAAASQSSPYYKFKFIRSAGNALLGTALALSFIAIVAASGSLYRASENGTARLGFETRDASHTAEKIIAKSPIYFHAGVAAVGRSVAMVSAPQIADTNSSGNSSVSFLGSLEALGSRISGLFDRTTLAFVDGATSLFGRYFPHVEIRATKLAIEASSNKEIATNQNSGGASGSAEAMAVVPSTGNAAEDRKIQTYIKNTFSDDVKVVSKNDDGTGVIQPVFKSGKPDKYLYVIVPVPDGS